MILTKITTLEFSVAKRICKASPELKLTAIIGKSFFSCSPRFFLLLLSLQSLGRLVGKFPAILFKPLGRSRDRGVTAHPPLSLLGVLLSEYQRELALRTSPRELARRSAIRFLDSSSRVGARPPSFL